MPFEAPPHIYKRESDEEKAAYLCMQPPPHLSHRAAEMSCLQPFRDYSVSGQRTMTLYTRVPTFTIWTPGDTATCSVSWAFPQ